MKRTLITNEDVEDIITHASIEMKCDKSQVLKRAIALLHMALQSEKVILFRRDENGKLKEEEVLVKSGWSNTE